MLTQALETAMNDQITNEMFASNQYLAMSAYFDHLSLPGFAQWMRVQAEEEREHAMKFYDFIHDRNGRVRIGAVPEPVVEFDSPLEVFEKALLHEGQLLRQRQGRELLQDAENGGGVPQRLPSHRGR
jgi:ferritin